MTDQLPERISCRRPIGGDVIVNCDIVGWNTETAELPKSETLFLRADTAIPRAEADAMVAAAFEQAQHTAQIAWDWPESEASSAPVCEAIAKLTPADARAAFDQAVREAAEAAYIEGGKAAREDQTEFVQEAVEAERERCAKIAETVPYTRDAMTCACSEGLGSDIAAAIRAPQETSE